MIIKSTSPYWRGTARVAAAAVIACEIKVICTKLSISGKSLDRW